MADEIFFSSLFIELDALLDTRIAILANMEGKVLENAILDDYHNRKIDAFRGASFNEFRTLYDNRDKSILKETMVTGMAGLIKEFVEKTLKNITTSPFHNKPKIILNVHPYVLTEEEINVLVKSLVIITDGLSDVQVVNMSYDDITPMYVKANLSILVLYECYRWLETHSVNELFKKVTCPDVALFGPRIFFKEFNPNTKHEVDPLDAMEKIAAPLIGLILLPIDRFSINLPAVEEEKQEKV